MRRSGHCFACLPEELRADRQVALAAVRKCGKVYRFASAALRRDKKFLNAARTGVARHHYQVYPRQCAPGFFSGFKCVFCEREEDEWEERTHAQSKAQHERDEAYAKRRSTARQERAL